MSVYGLAVAARSQPQFLERLETLLRTDRAVPEQGPHAFERGGGIGQPLAYFAREVDRSGFPRNELLQEADVSAHVIKGNHAQAMADQRIVCVVPFRPLRIQPDTAAENEIAQLGEQWHQQFLEQGDTVDFAVAVEDQFTVSTVIGDTLLDASRERVIEDHRVLRIFEKIFEGLYAIGNVGIAEYRLVQQLPQPCRMKLLRQFEQFQQVNNLVVPPVSDVAPGVIGLLYFPIDTFLCYAIWIVSVDCRSIDELGDNVFDELRIAKGQCLPVLEDVAPVALVGKQPVARIVFQFNGEAVPGAARVAVAASEGDGQVFIAEPLKLRVAVRPDHRHELIEVDHVRQAAEQPLVTRIYVAVEVPYRMQEVARRDVVLVVENASTKCIEKNVCIMMRRNLFLRRNLESIDGSHDSSEFVVAHIDRARDDVLDIGFTLQ